MVESATTGNVQANDAEVFAVALPPGYKLIALDNCAEGRAGEEVTILSPKGTNTLLSSDVCVSSKAREEATIPPVSKKVSGRAASML